MSGDMTRGYDLLAQLDGAGLGRLLGGLLNLPAVPPGTAIPPIPMPGGGSVTLTLPGGSPLSVDLAPVPGQPVDASYVSSVGGGPADVSLSLVFSFSSGTLRRPGGTTASFGAGALRVPANAVRVSIPAGAGMGFDQIGFDVVGRSAAITPALGGGVTPAEQTAITRALVALFGLDGRQLLAPLQTMSGGPPGAPRRFDLKIVRTSARGGAVAPALSVNVNAGGGLTPSYRDVVKSDVPAGTGGSSSLVVSTALVLSILKATLTGRSGLEEVGRSLTLRGPALMTLSTSPVSVTLGGFAGRVNRFNVGAVTGPAGSGTAGLVLDANIVLPDIGAGFGADVTLSGPIDVAINPATGQVDVRANLNPPDVRLIFPLWAIGVFIGVGFILIAAGGIVGVIIGVIVAILIAIVVAVLQGAASSGLQGPANMGASSMMTLGPGFGLGAVLGSLAPTWATFDDLLVAADWTPRSAMRIWRQGVARVPLGTSFDLDYGIRIDDAGSGDGTADLIWSAADGGPSITPGPASGVVRAGRPFAALTVDDVRAALSRGSEVIPSHEIPLAETGRPLPPPLALAARTERGRFAKVGVWQDAGGDLILRYLVFDGTTAPTLQVVGSWANREEREISSGAVGFRQFTAIGTGTYTATPHLLPLPVTYEWTLEGQALRGSGRVTVEGSAVDFAVTGNRCTLTVGHGVPLRGRLCCHATGSNGVRLIRCARIARSEVLIEIDRAVFLAAERFEAGLIGLMAERDLFIDPLDDPAPFERAKLAEIVYTALETGMKQDFRHLPIR